MREREALECSDCDSGCTRRPAAKPFVYQHQQQAIVVWLGIRESLLPIFSPAFLLLRLPSSLPTNEPASSPSLSLTLASLIVTLSRIALSCQTTDSLHLSLGSWESVGRSAAAAVAKDMGSRLKS